MTSSAHDIQGTVIEVLTATVEDWDLELDGGIGPTTTLIEDLAFESIDIVQFCVALEQKLGRKGLPFERLFIREGNYVDDVSVAEIADFLAAELQTL